jgi:hypothetical protein
MIITIDMYELYKCDEGLYVSILNKARTCIALSIVTYCIIIVLDQMHPTMRCYIVHLSIKMHFNT